MLALPLGDNVENKIFRSYTLSDDYYKIIEPAGRPFEELVKKRLQQNLPDFLGSGEGDDDDLKMDETDLEELWWEKEHKLLGDKENKLFTSKEDNYYAMLGIEELFLKADENDIRKAYKRVALIYHPDKNKNNISLQESGDNNNNKENDTEEKDNEEMMNLIKGKNKDKDKENKDKEKEKDQNNTKNTKENKGARYVNPDEEEGTNITDKILTDDEKKKLDINNKWLKIKEAYDTLLDPEKRKKYDSTFEFDETIPEDKKVSEKDFFLSYGPTFMKNSIWSKRKPIPKLGDMNTPIEKVKRFYKFWFNFVSWRDFVAEGEYNLEGKELKK